MFPSSTCSMHASMRVRKWTTPFAHQADPLTSSGVMAARRASASACAACTSASRPVPFTAWPSAMGLNPECIAAGADEAAAAAVLAGGGPPELPAVLGMPASCCACGAALPCFERCRPRANCMHGCQKGLQIQARQAINFKATSDSCMSRGSARVADDLALQPLPAETTAGSCCRNHAWGCKPSHESLWASAAKQSEQVGG